VFTYEHEQGELPGVTVRLNAEKHSGLDVIQSEAMRTQLKQVARKVKTDLEQKHKKEARVCLVFGPADCIYFESNGELDSTRPPVGGTLCNAQCKPMVIAAEPHWRASESDPIILKRA
jgi:Pyruvate/2-oxoacid:ferredoxin oxidoreductase delta subunit